MCVAGVLHTVLEIKNVWDTKKLQITNSMYIIVYLDVSKTVCINDKI